MTGTVNEQIDLEAVYKESYPSVRAYILQNSGSEDEAKDIFQEAMINAWLNVKQGRYALKAGASIGAYIYTIAKYKWLDKLKSKSHRSTVRLVHDEVKDKELEGLDDEADVSYLTGLFTQLDVKCQDLLKRFYYQNMSMREIAADIAVGEDSVRTMKYRCVMKLRKLHLAQQEQEKRDT